jgi:hypothetical protein
LTKRERKNFLRILVHRACSKRIFWAAQPIRNKDRKDWQTLMCLLQIELRELGQTGIKCILKRAKKSCIKSSKGRSKSKDSNSRRKIIKNSRLKHSR